MSDETCLGRALFQNFTDVRSGVFKVFVKHSGQVSIEDASLHFQNLIYQTFFRGGNKVLNWDELCGYYLR